MDLDLFSHTGVLKVIKLSGYMNCCFGISFKAATCAWNFFYNFHCFWTSVLWLLDSFFNGFWISFLDWP